MSLGKDTSPITLEATIGDYGYHGVKNCLSAEGGQELQKGIAEYDASHQKRVERYKATHRIMSDTAENDHDFLVAKPNDPQFFRKEFINYLHQHKSPPFAGDKSKRATHPETATTSLEHLLGPQGVELYHLALEEEAHSLEYRQAVVIKATSHLDGNKWERRPVVIVSGPSGCGKSFAAESAIEMADKFLPIKEDDLSGNDIIAVDGGIVREISQMRKLAVQIANQNGYTGIEDLPKQSKVLEKIKGVIKDAAFATPSLGVVIPETFSNWCNPVEIIKNAVNGNLMEEIDKLENTQQLHVRVDGKEPEVFQKTVAYMGSRRAWQVNGFKEDGEEPIAVELNKKGLSESKAYGANGFKFGVYGSSLAEYWYRTFSKNKLCMLITNDLHLLKPTEDGSWVPAEKGEKGARLVSDKMYKIWSDLIAKDPANASPLFIKLKPDPENAQQWIEAAPEDEQAPTFYTSVYLEWQALPDDENKPSLQHYHKQKTIIIQTSAQVDLQILKRRIEERLKQCEKEIFAEHLKNPVDDDRIAYLMTKRGYLLHVRTIEPEHLETRAGLTSIQNKTQNIIEMLKEEKTWGRTFFSATLRALENISKILDKASNSLQKELPSNGVLSGSFKDRAKEINSERNKIAVAPEEDSSTDSYSF